MNKSNITTFEILFNYYSEILLFFILVIFFIYLCFIYFVYNKVNNNKYNNSTDNLNNKKSYKNIFKSSYILFLIIIISFFLFDLLTYVDFTNNNIIILKCSNEEYLYNNYGNLINLFNKTESDVIMKLFINFLLIILLILSYDYLVNIKMFNYQYILIIGFNFLIISLLIICVDLFLFFILVEIQAFTFIILTAINFKNQFSSESSLKYFILNSISSTIMLSGIILFYGLYGVTNIYDLKHLLYYLSASNNISSLHYIAVFFTLIGFLFKLYIAPFHFWISDIYNANYMINTTIISTIGYLSLFYVFFKFYIYIFSIINLEIYYILLSLSLITIVISGVCIMFENNIKKIMAYSSTFTSGLLLFNLLNNEHINNVNVIFYLINYVVNIFILLVLIMPLFINDKKVHLDNIENLNGFYKKNPIYCMYITISSLGCIGIPGSSLFFSKLFVFLSSIDYFDINFVYFIMFCTSGIFTYLLRILINMYFLKSNEFNSFRKLSFINYFVCFFLILFVLLFIIYQPYVYYLSEYIVSNI